jgi:hypothetical protein
VKVADIQFDLVRDTHLADCGLAKASGPDATLACADCGRAKWMHSTRHDTCGQFQWVRPSGITREVADQLLYAEDLKEIKNLERACQRMLGLNYWGSVWEAQNLIAKVINTAKHVVERGSR